MKYPLVFSYTDYIDHKKWSAIIVAQGRCVMDFEDDDWWIEGVEPGGLAAHGEQPALAIKDFRDTWSKVIEDAASGKKSYDDFQRELETLFHQVNEPADRDWQLARHEIQKAQLGEPFASMPKVFGPFDTSLRIYATQKPEAAAHPGDMIPVEQTALIDDRKIA